MSTPIESAHGDPQTDRVSVITFTADDGNAVDPHFRDTFTLAFKARQDLGVLPFKVIQDCEVGENAWIDVGDGTGAEPDSPAPSVEVVASSGAPAGDHDGADAGATDTTVAGTETRVELTPTTVTATASGSDDSSSNGLAITGIVVGGLGLVAGGTALARGRRPGA